MVPLIACINPVLIIIRFQSRENPEQLDFRNQPVDSFKKFELASAALSQTVLKWYP